MDDIEERLIRLEEIVKGLTNSRRMFEKTWEKFLERDERLYKTLTEEVKVIRRRVNGWFYFALGIAAAGGGILTEIARRLVV